MAGTGDRQWEYLKGWHSEERFIDQMNSLGRMGWELVSATYLRWSCEDGRLCIFKRPVGWTAPK